MSNFFSNIWTHVAGVAAATEAEAQKIAIAIINDVEVAAHDIDSLFKYAAAKAPALAADVAALAPLAMAATNVVTAFVPGANAAMVAGDIAAVMAGAAQASKALTEIQQLQAQAAPGSIGAATADAASALKLYQAVQSTSATIAAARATAVNAVTSAKAAAAQAATLTPPAASPAPAP